MRSLGVALALWLKPAAAQACSYCASAQGPAGNGAYYLTTLLMLLAVLSLAGGLVAWLWVVGRDREQSPSAGTFNRLP